MVVYKELCVCSTFPGNTFFVLNSHSLCESRFEGGSLLAALQVAKDWLVHHLEVLDLQVALGHDRGDGPLAHPGEKFVRDQEEVSNDDIHPLPLRQVGLQERIAGKKVQVASAAPVMQFSTCAYLGLAAT